MEGDIDIKGVFKPSKRAVDFVCCGVMMTRRGSIFELIKGAVEDCSKRVLRRTKIECAPETTMGRIKKLVNRGWKVQ